MSWHARQQVAGRIRPILAERRQQRQERLDVVRREDEEIKRRERHKLDAMLWSEAVRMEADYWYESITPDEPELIAERRALLETEYRR
jgi:hypothetical protein